MWLLLLDKTVFCDSCEAKSEPLNAKAQSCDAITQHTSLCPSVPVIKWTGMLTEELWGVPQTVWQKISCQVQSTDQVSKFYLKNTNGKTTLKTYAFIFKHQSRRYDLVWHGFNWRHLKNARVPYCWDHGNESSTSTKSRSSCSRVTCCCQLIWPRHATVPTVVLWTNFMPHHSPQRLLRWTTRVKWNIPTPARSWEKSLSTTRGWCESITDVSRTDH